jgi:hypothetical protein
MIKQYSDFVPMDAEEHTAQESMNCYRFISMIKLARLFFDEEEGGVKALRRNSINLVATGESVLCRVYPCEICNREAAAEDRLINSFMEKQRWYYFTTQLLQDSLDTFLIYFDNSTAITKTIEPQTTNHQTSITNIKI